MARHRQTGTLSLAVLPSARPPTEIRGGIEKAAAGLRSPVQRLVGLRGTALPYCDITMLQPRAARAGGRDGQRERESNIQARILVLLPPLTGDYENVTAQKNKKKHEGRI